VTCSRRHGRFSHRPCRRPLLMKRWGREGSRFLRVRLRPTLDGRRAPAIRTVAPSDRIAAPFHFRAAKRYIMPRSTPHPFRVCQWCGRLFMPAVGLGATQAAKQRCCSHRCGALLQHARRRGGPLDDLSDLADLSPLDLLVATAEVRQQWSEAERLQRLRPDERPVPWSPPVVEGAILDAPR